MDGFILDGDVINEVGEWSAIVSPNRFEPSLGVDFSFLAAPRNKTLPTHTFLLKILIYYKIHILFKVLF